MFLSLFVLQEEQLHLMLDKWLNGPILDHSQLTAVKSGLVVLYTFW